MENPPSNIDLSLRAYLIRLITQIEEAITNKSTIPPTYSLPTKPLEGKLYYFPNTIAPTITTAGVWVYKSSGWAFLG